MSDGEPIASFRAVSKSYDGIAEALRGLTLDIAPGVFLSVLGPAGAGKSTALSVLAGLNTPDAGTVWLRGQDVTLVPAERRGLGVVFAAPSLFPHLDVAANVAFPLAIRRLGRAEREAKVARMLDLLSLEGLATLHPAQLTTEQQQRVALARALAFGPDLVLLDEPLGTLQGPERDALRADLRRVQRELGTAMLYATRDAAEALMLSDRVAVLHKGALRQVAPPHVLYEQPADTVVADSTGANNSLRGRVVGIEDDMARIKLRAGPEVEARAGDALRPGDACVVCIRPERVALAAISAREMGEDALSAVVLESAYRGDHVLIRLTLGEETELLVKRPAAAGMAGLGLHQPASVAWQPHHAHAFLPES